MPRYAAKTSVPVERTRDEIERTLERYGADSFISGWDSVIGQEVIAFRYGGVQIRIQVERPNECDDPQGQLRRQRWRALLLVIKAKLEAVDSKISTFEEEFLAWVVVGNITIGQQLLPNLRQIVADGNLPPLLPILPEPNTKFIDAKVTA